MAELNTSVCISGFVLGSLMFQHFNSDSDAEGFILGECKAEETSNITDSQIDNIQFEHLINIEKHIPCLRLGSFYNNIGEVNPDDIRRILSSCKENLKKALSNHELVFLLLTPTKATPSGSTHRLEYSVYRSHGSQYHNLPVLVSNLGMLEQQDYWRLSVPCSSLSSCQAVKKHRSKFFCKDGSLSEVNEINNMNDTLQTELQAACVKLEKSERSIETLLADISALRTAVTEKKQKQACEKDQLRASIPPQNVMLCEAMRTLFPQSPLLQTQTLTQGGAPAVEFCCSACHGFDISSSLPLIETHWDAQARKWRTGKQARSWGKRGLAEEFQQTKRKRKRRGADTDSEGPLMLSGSETEDELLASQNGNQETSNSPVF
ncbi:hypothetical protein COCON_G00166350 [Conger conger]|uniref:BRCA1-A complex subunit Abraxas 1 n=1 Tax=Conger conger TaxID=82655 RepID=A0A9Q1HS26_CONCO|nr:hypothetical protein COCON_G00166350 [Conger conger]